jgi:hypothetical protein
MFDGPTGPVGRRMRRAAQRPPGPDTPDRRRRGSPRHQGLVLAPHPHRHSAECDGDLRTVGQRCLGGGMQTTAGSSPVGWSDNSRITCRGRRRGVDGTLPRCSPRAAVIDGSAHPLRTSGSPRPRGRPRRPTRPPGSQTTHHSQGIGPCPRRGRRPTSPPRRATRRSCRARRGDGDRATPEPSAHRT